MILSPDEAAQDVCQLETIGRVSGQPRRIDIWFAADGDRVYLLSGGGHNAHWVRNLGAEPAVRIRIGGRWLAGVARVVEGADDEPLARELLAIKYQGWQPGRSLSGWARTAVPVRIDLSSG